MSSQKRRIIGAMCAIEREFSMIRKCFERELQSEDHCGRTFYIGKISGQTVVISKSGIGKVAAASTAAIMISVFSCSEIIFLGVAGGIQGRAAIGDIVVSAAAIQHDFDGRPWVERSVVFSVGTCEIPADERLQTRAQAAVQTVLADDMTLVLSDDSVPIGRRILAQLGRSPKLLIGSILSGDQFVSSDEMNKELGSRFESALCVEMEGAAVAQICYEAKVPYIIVRAISDSGSGEANIQFDEFCNSISSPLMLAILKSYLASTSEFDYGAMSALIIIQFSIRCRHLTQRSPMEKWSSE